MELPPEPLPGLYEFLNSRNLKFSISITSASDYPVLHLHGKRRIPLHPCVTLKRVEQIMYLHDNPSPCMICMVNKFRKICVRCNYYVCNTCSVKLWAQTTDGKTVCPCCGIRDENGIKYKPVDIERISKELLAMPDLNDMSLRVAKQKLWDVHKY